MLITDQAEHCHDSMCLFLRLGYVLLTADLCVDVPWVLHPSNKTATRLRKFYTFILTPTWYCPGYWWPCFAIYVFLHQCPDSYNWMTFWLFVPVAYRYYFILTQPDNQNHSQMLSNWWTIVLIRIVLFVVVFNAIRQRGCQWHRVFDHWVGLYEYFSAAPV